MPLVYLPHGTVGTNHISLAEGLVFLASICNCCSCGTNNFVFECCTRLSQHRENILYLPDFLFWQVWNASNGHLLNKLEPVEENEVTGIISLPEKSKIVIVGWNRMILVYYDDIQVRIPAWFGVIFIVKLNPSLY